MVERIEILVEEPSMEVFLQGLISRCFADLNFSIYPFQCKSEMLEELPKRLHGYRKWLPLSWKLLILIDRDNEDCRRLKRQLEEFSKDARFLTCSTIRSGDSSDWQIANRIVIEELESWYFGDWQAVKEIWPKVPTTIPQKEKYRNPESIAGGTWEAFEKILQRAGYYSGGLRKRDIAKRLAGVMVPERNQSKSFQVFYRTLEELNLGRPHKALHQW